MEKIDWQAEVAKRQDALLADLQTLLKIKSERDTKHATADAPLGPGPAKALDTMLTIGRRDGFTTKNVGNVAGRIAYGSGDEIFGIFGHLDVVPAGDDWATDPYAPVIKDGRIYGRGTADDKGPALAAYYGLKIVKDLGLPVHKQIHYIFGTDEESEWVGIHTYLKSEPVPAFGFSPDAEFPIINGEKGIADFTITVLPPKQPAHGDYQLHSFTAGIRTNMVPGRAIAVVSGANPGELLQSFNAFLASHPVDGNMTGEAEGDNITLTVTGKVAHASTPDQGINAAAYLAMFLNSQPLAGLGAAYVQVIANYLAQDTDGTQLGISHHDALMGDLSASADLFYFNAAEHKAMVTINVRYPQGTSDQTINRQIVQTIGADRVTSEIVGDPEPPHYVSGDDPLVKTLLQVYTDHTGQPGHEQIVGGGTYGRVIPRGVAFGAELPDTESVMHQANEYMPLSELWLATAIYADAIYRLAQ
ncbi:dipeptidase PepV [Schleiferilactobacillus shenzhenensis]|uniref:PepV n=1 Tax=Schleiferilactobacillus shenzhenensis LY-73 TaxID=1231336 RepID=U4TMN2_9LACO|nr:dipeptidase PepV [Schleiferilactobacillus shenzhenensis]ERL65469.1 PepV [Schleiferilactobacillus shenzhenensis LY-73]